MINISFLRRNSSSSSRTLVDDVETKEHLLVDPDHEYYQRYQRRTPLLWKAATCLLAISSTVLLMILLFKDELVQPSEERLFGSFEHGFETEIQNGFSAIELERVQFTGGLRYNEHGMVFRNINAAQPQFVGTPSPEMDEAWNRLVGGRYVHFRDEYKGPGADLALSQPPDNVIEIGVDALHALHCLNRIRKTLDYDYYKDFLAGEGANNRLHVEHCVDYIRQLLQCKADLTPLPVYWSENARRVLPDFDRIHTCRNFDKIREWATVQDRRILEQFPGSDVN